MPDPFTKSRVRLQKNSKSIKKEGVAKHGNSTGYGFLLAMSMPYLVRKTCFAMKKETCFLQKIIKAAISAKKETRILQKRRKAAISAQKETRILQKRRKVAISAQRAAEIFLCIERGRCKIDEKSSMEQ